MRAPYLKKKFTEIAEGRIRFSVQGELLRGRFFCSPSESSARWRERGGGTIIFVLGSGEPRGVRRSIRPTNRIQACAARDRSLNRSPYEFGHLGRFIPRRSMWMGAVDSPRVARGDARRRSVVVRLNPSVSCQEIVHVESISRKSSWTFQIDLRSYSQWRPRVASEEKNP